MDGPGSRHTGSVQTFNELSIGKRNNSAPMRHVTGFVRLDPNLRGAIIADDRGIRGAETTVTVYHNSPNLDTYRMAFLFNDVLEVPMFDFIGPPLTFDPFGLYTSNLVNHSMTTINGMVTFDDINDLPVELYRILDLDGSGQWTLWHEPDHEPLSQKYQLSTLAAKIALQNSILIPTREVPFEELVNFRTRNFAQLRRLRLALDMLALKVSQSGFDEETLRVELESLKIAVEDHIEEARKTNIKLSVGKLSVKINWSEAIVKSAGLAFAAVKAGFPLTPSALAGLLASVSIESERGLVDANSRSPYEYIASIDREFGI